MVFPRLSLLLPILALVACAGPGPNPDDPYEAHNREVHAANKVLDQQIFGDGQGDSRVPPIVGETVVNFADNLSLPGAVVNNLLQLDLAGAGRNTLRFVMNTTLGVGGLFDPADDVGLYEDEADFAQTLAHYGVGEGAYLELPVLGPQTQRDVAGRVGDWVLNPLGDLGTPAQQWLLRGVKLAARAVKRDQYGDTIDDVLYGSADSYTQQRLIYLQNRRFELGDQAESIDPYADLYGDE